MTEPVKDPVLVPPGERMARLRKLLTEDWSNVRNINKIEFHKVRDAGRWVHWTGDPIEP